MSLGLALSNVKFDWESHAWVGCQGVWVWVGTYGCGVGVGCGSWGCVAAHSAVNVLFSVTSFRFSTGFHPVNVNPLRVGFCVSGVALPPLIMDCDNNAWFPAYVPPFRLNVTVNVGGICASAVGVTELETADATLAPIAFVAVTVNV